MNATPDQTEFANGTPVSPAIQGNGRWQLFAHKTGEMDYHIPGRPDVAQGLITAVSPEGKIHTFEFTSGGATFKGSAREQAPGLDWDIDGEQNGQQGVYALDFEGHWNYHANSTSSQFADEDGTGSQLRMNNVDGMQMGGRNGFLIHTRSSNIPAGSAGCLVLEDAEEDRFFGLMEQIRREDPSALPTHLTMLADETGQDANTELTDTFEVAHATGERDGEREVTDEVTEEMLAIAEANKSKIGANKNYGGRSPEELLIFLGTHDQAAIQSEGLWTGHESSRYASSTVRNLQTTELKNYYPQAGTEGLSARAMKIAGDGLVGEITHHGAQLSQDADGSFANNHIADTLQKDFWGDSEILKLDASLNRYAELTEGVDVVPVDGVIREADTARLMQYIEANGPLNGGEALQLGNAAVQHLLKNGVSVDDLSKASGMDIKAIEEAKEASLNGLSDNMNIALAQNTSLMEAGTTDLKRATFQIANDTGGSKSYGFMGLNSGANGPSMSSTAGQFAQAYPELGLTATPGTAAFNAQWTNAANTNMDALLGAQLEFYQVEMIAPAQEKLATLGLSEFANDPGVLNYVSDSIIQYGAGNTINSHLRAGSGASDSKDFLNRVAEAQHAKIPENFRSYLSGSGAGNQQGLHNRVDKRLASSMQLQRHFDSIAAQENTLVAEAEKPSAKGEFADAAAQKATAQIALKTTFADPAGKIETPTDVANDPANVSRGNFNTAATNTPADTNVPAETPSADKVANLDKPLPKVQTFDV